MTRDELQALYDRLGSQVATAQYLHIGTANIGPWLRERGVVTKPHGGQTRGTGVPRESRYRTNLATGDGALFAKSVQVTVCTRGLLVLGKPRRCVLDACDCDACFTQHQFEFVTGGGAASGWTRETAGNSFV